MPRKASLSGKPKPKSRKRLSAPVTDQLVKKPKVEQPMDPHKLTVHQSHQYLWNAHHMEAGPSSAPVGLQRSFTFSATSITARGPLQSVQVATCSKSLALEHSINPNFRVKPPERPDALRLRVAMPDLPEISWSKPTEVWNLMCWKESVYGRDPHLFPKHPEIQPRMRAILFDWLTEVCEVHNLHRETYHLAIDFVDRFLSKQRNVPKTRLQLVGVTALFIAAKLEEIYPPKLAEFAYVTDGACSEQEILMHELVMLKSLNWSLSPVTACHWLSTYLQLCASKESSARDPFYSQNCRRNLFSPSGPEEFALPRFHRHYFLQLCQVIDLCLLDAGCLQFPYSVLAASALYSMLEPADVALRLSGFTWNEIAPCVHWMSPMVGAVRERQEVGLSPKLKDIPVDDQHNIQSHEFDLGLLDRAQILQQELLRSQRSSPVFLNQSYSNIFPTPPQSDERPNGPFSRLPHAFLTPQ